MCKASFPPRLVSDIFTAPFCLDWCNTAIQVLTFTFQWLIALDTGLGSNFPSQGLHRERQFIPLYLLLIKPFNNSINTVPDQNL